MFSSHYRFFTDGLGTEYSTWNYIKQLEKDVTIAYSPDVAMPQPYKSNGCHAWQGCDGFDSLGKFDPGVVILSPEYPHYNFTEYNKYVNEHGYKLVKIVKPNFSLDSYKCTNNLRFGVGGNTGILNFIQFEKLLSNVATCIDDYSFMLDNYNTGSISGLPKYIYKK
ncbi:hypothetical protein GCM10027342_15000 [Photobacterium alginatilyticum]